jgi:hypothetical protein
MSDPFAFWVFLALLGGTATAIWLLTGHVMRQEDDLAADERAAEVAWVSATIEDAGGDVPEAVVEQVLELHRHYLRGAASLVDDGRTSGEAPVPEPSPAATGLRTGR